MVIGILALQGGFRAHRDMLNHLGVATRDIRLTSELDEIDGLILPGGESSTMLKLLAREEGMQERIQSLGEKGLPILGTCAGAILLCNKVLHPSQDSLKCIPASIERNAYGSQRESFETDFPIQVWGLERVHALFIRAPRFVDIEDSVTIISTMNEDISGVTFKNFTAVTYHPELTSDTSFHQAWLERHGMGVK